MTFRILTDDELDELRAAFEQNGATESEWRALGYAYDAHGRPSACASCLRRAAQIAEADFYAQLN